MAEFKKLSAVEMVNKVANTANVLIEEDGVVKKVNKNLISVQADWAETDESSIAFIKNKPIEEYDLDITAKLVSINDDGNFEWDYDIHHISSFEELVSKLENGICPKTKVVFDTTSVINNTDTYVNSCISVGYPECGCDYYYNYGAICFGSWSWERFSLYIVVYSGDFYIEVQSQ